MLLNVFFGEQAQDRAGEQSKDSCSGSAGVATEVFVEFPDDDDLTPNSNPQDLSHLCF